MQYSILEGHKQWGHKVKQSKRDELRYRYGTYFTYLTLGVP